MFISFGTLVPMIAAPIVAFIASLTMHDKVVQERDGQMDKLQEKYTNLEDDVKKRIEALENSNEMLRLTVRAKNKEIAYLKDEITEQKNEIQYITNLHIEDSVRYKERKKQVAKLEKENNELHTLANNQGRLLQELRHELESQDTVRLKEDNNRMRQRIEDLITVNKEQALALSKKEAKVRKELLREYREENECEPTDDDLQYITNNLDLLLINREEDMTNYDHV